MRLLMIKQIFLLPHVKRGKIISNKLVYESCLRRCLPANICLDEGVLKTPWRCVLPSSSEDVLITMNIFALVIRLQKTSSRCLQDVLIKTNVFILAIRLQDVFKTFSKRLKTSCKNVFKISSRRLANSSSRRLAKTSSRHLQKCLQEIF